jgi:hypothetical protein
MLESEQKNSNPISDLITDEIFDRLAQYRLLNSKSLRNYKLRNQFKELMSANLPTSKAIEILRKEYPYLESKTIRKIISGNGTK